MTHINKVLKPSDVNGLRLRPGASAEHGKYIERDSAVAQREPELSVGDPPDQWSARADHPVYAIPAIINEERNDVVRKFEESVYARFSRIDFRFAGSDLFGADDSGAGAGSDLLQVPGSALGSHQRRAGRVVQNDPLLGLGPPQRWQDARGLPRAGSCDRSAAQAAESRGLNQSEAQGHDRYIARASAVAVQPDGERVLFTNIDSDPQKREEFWTLVEEHESTPGPDKMTIHFGADPAFWRRIGARPDCPPEIKAALAAPDEKARARFEISSGREVRAFLARQQGWPRKRKKGSGEAGEDNHASKNALATFHDGRGGRSQYRIIGELPHELSHPGKIRLLKRIAAEFERRNIPFVAVMHAPDHTNNEKNWHFHLIYYDRPCRRLTEQDLAWAEQDGFDISSLAVGHWDFAARPLKKGKEQVPFRQKKLRELTRKVDPWPERMRRRIAWLANDELKREGEVRRLDPRRHDEMGIKVDPGEKLHTGLAVGEGLGLVSEKGVRNEERQWTAIIAQFDDNLARERQRISREFEQYRAQARSLADWSAEPGHIGRIDAAEQAAQDAVERDDAAERLHQIIARLASRAVYLRDLNRQWLDAEARRECELKEKERRKRAALITDAAAYLDALAPLIEEGEAIIETCRREAKDLRLASDFAIHLVTGDYEEALEQRELAAARAKRLGSRAPAQSKIIPTSDPHGATANDEIPSFLERLARARPLVRRDGNKYWLATAASPPANVMADARVAKALAERYAAQEGEASEMGLWVQRNARLLVREAGKWKCIAKNAADREEFERLREHPTVAHSIVEVMHSSAGKIDIDIAAGGKATASQLERGANAAARSHTVRTRRSGTGQDVRPAAVAGEPQDKRLAVAIATGARGEVPAREHAGMGDKALKNGSPDGRVDQGSADPRHEPKRHPGELPPPARERIAPMADALAEVMQSMATRKALPDIAEAGASRAVPLSPKGDAPHPSGRAMHSTGTPGGQASERMERNVDPKRSSTPSRSKAKIIARLDDDDEMRAQAKAYAIERERKRQALEAELRDEESRKPVPPRTQPAVSDTERKANAAARREAFNRLNQGRDW